MLGIDVSQGALACALLDRPTERFRWERSVRRTEAGVQQLLHLTPPEVPWVLEPTGSYSTMVARLAQAAGRTVLLAPPRKAKAYLQSISSRAKTDRLDARGLALFAASRTSAEALRDYPVKGEAVEQLDQLLAARRGVVAALTSLQQQRRELPHARAVLDAAIAGLRTQRTALDQQLAALTSAEGAFPLAVRLQKIPGIGPVSAAAVASRLAARDFERADAFVAYLGLDVGVRRSGQRDGQLGLTKQGDADLRRLLYLAAAANVRSPQSPFRTQYDRELAKGLSKIAALNAVARKLARLCWSLAKHNSEYDPQWVHQQRPPTKPSVTPPVTPAAPPSACEIGAVSPVPPPASSSAPQLSLGGVSHATTAALDGPTPLVIEAASREHAVNATAPPAASRKKRRKST